MEGFGLRLEKLRDEAGYTKRQMSQKLNFSMNVYGEYEREQAKPSIETAGKLAKFFNVSLDFLVYGEEYQQEKHKSFEKLIRVFQENGIKNPYIFELEKWEVLNADDIQYLQKNFEWVVHNAKTRK